MAAKVKDITDALKGPVHRELLKREGQRKSKVQFIPHDYHGEDTPTAPGGEGKDSEGKEKVLHLSMADSAAEEASEPVDNPEEEQAEA